MVTEALLEMHFHSALVDLFESHFGRRVFRLIKPSPQLEKFVGFDQGWATTTAQSDREFLDELREKIESATKGTYEGRFVGYFLQFKAGRRTARKSRFTPAGFPARAFRFELDVEVPKADAIWPWSQHETLVRLQTVFGASGEISYACPMIFDDLDVYEPPCGISPIAITETGA